MDFYNYSFGLRTIGLTKLPSRKKIALVKSEPGVSTVLAYFQDEESAQFFMDFMSEVVRSMGNK